MTGPYTWISNDRPLHMDQQTGPYTWISNDRPLHKSNDRPLHMDQQWPLPISNDRIQDDAQQSDYKVGLGKMNLGQTH